MASRRKTKATGTELAFEAITIEGGLLSPDWLARVAQLAAEAQTEADYRVPGGLNLRDEIGRFWRIAQHRFGEFNRGLAAGGDRRLLVETFIVGLLRSAFEFQTLEAVAPVERGGRLFPIGHAALGGRVPVVITAPNSEPPAGEKRRSALDDARPEHGDATRRRSAFGLAQEFLNAADEALWGIATDGLTLRVLRDNASLTRPAWIEIDLARIFTEERYADFAALWLLAHETRFGRAGHPVTDCPLEAWRNAGREQGTRVRAALRGGVEQALLALGNGFLAADNPSLRADLASGALTKEAYFQELLRLVYRLIFLLTVEERGVLHATGASDEARALYAEGYSVRRLRERAVRRSAHDRFGDLWEGLKIVFRGVAVGEPRLGLPALAGLFAPHQCPHLDGAKLANRDLLAAMFRLSWHHEDGGLERVNWRDMGPEELGSVYESLLELVPQIIDSGRAFAFATGGETKGNARKLTGSYYTPDSLVQVLLDSALEPVAKDAMAANPQDPAGALLKLAVVDPACGSGHFLLAAARRLAGHVARLRSSGTPSAEEYRHALREVVGRCIFGVDLNPLAVELCKVSLWMEAVEPGRPLSFLDSHIQQGNALLGTTPELMDKGIPDAAWEPIEGDDKKVASALKKRNKQAAASGQRGLESLWASPAKKESEDVARAVAELDAAPDADAQALAKKEETWEALRRSEAYRHQRFVADAWCAAFVWPKQPGPLVDAAPTNELWRQLRDGKGKTPALTEKTVEELRAQHSFFHWHLAFPQVFARGGFDVVLGNPPWERLKLQEQEWFATRDPRIATAPNAAARRALIAALAETDNTLHLQFKADSRAAEAEPAFLRNSGRFPLCGCGRDINTAAVFLELISMHLAPRGMAGCITPASSVLGDTTKDFIAAIMEHGRLPRLYHFENEELVFPGVHHAFRFCLVVLSGTRAPTTTAEFVFYARNVSQLSEAARRVNLTAADIVEVNPITRTLPAVRCAADARLTVSIHRRVPILGAEVSGQDLGWQIATRPGHYHMSNDAELFLPGDSLRRDRSDVVPLYESKMMSLFDHRFGTYEGQTIAQSNQGKLPETTDEWHANASNVVKARYYLPRKELALKTSGAWDKPWCLGIREITSATSERTAIAALLPDAATGHTLTIAISPIGSAKEHLLILAAINAIVTDFVARQKVNGTHLIPSVLRQLPIPARKAFDDPCTFDIMASWASWIVLRAFELTYTAWDLEPFAHDVGYDGPPFVWNPDRRFLLRAELDAAFFHLYGISRDDAAYILDTFPIVRKNDEKAHGEYRTKRVILEIYDALAKAARTGRPYQTRLDPPPADARVAHPARRDEEQSPLAPIIPLRRPAPAQPQPDSPASAPVEVPEPRPSYAIPAVMGAAPRDLDEVQWPARRSLAFDAAGLSLEELTIFTALAVLDVIKESPDKEVLWWATLFVRQPSLLTAILSAADAKRWRDAVGAEAANHEAGAATFVPKADAAWGATLRWLRGKVLLEGTERGHWTIGNPEFVRARAKPELVARARIALRAIEQIKVEQIPAAVERYWKEARGEH